MDYKTLSLQPLPKDRRDPIITLLYLLHITNFNDKYTPIPEKIHSTGGVIDFYDRTYPHRIFINLTGGETIAIIPVSRDRYIITDKEYRYSKASWRDLGKYIVSLKRSGVSIDSIEIHNNIGSMGIMFPGGEITQRKIPQGLKDVPL